MSVNIKSGVYKTEGQYCLSLSVPPKVNAPSPYLAGTQVRLHIPQETVSKKVIIIIHIFHIV